LKTAFNWAVERKTAENQPCGESAPEPRAEEPASTVLTEAEIQRLRDEIAEDAALSQVVDAALWTGMRRNEDRDPANGRLNLDRNVLR